MASVFTSPVRRISRSVLQIAHRRLRDEDIFGRTRVKCLPTLLLLAHALSSLIFLPPPVLTCKQTTKHPAGCSQHRPPFANLLANSFFKAKRCAESGGEAERERNIARLPLAFLLQFSLHNARDEADRLPARRLPPTCQHARLPSAE